MLASYQAARVCAVGGEAVWVGKSAADMADSRAVHTERRQCEG